ncbi:helix-turn-helix domain-containing protein [Halomicrobium sp. IBSBa]|uniref:DNA-binding protein n=1 Tax=Halomicrobium mukohataei TaxID=57705 RepID=A0A847UER1_9EURY|nr:MULTISPECIES: helix-turn-helix domain-containing protein [Halomicrobium]MBO4249151.1 helix-turn-helix domain-containing protein [Halomicrobium sp. IBSBa]NLV09914.1 DNA-binding protein [Halomicrobium mukohataei]
MKHLRVTAHVDPERAPAFFTLLANSEAIEEARVIEVNTTPEGDETLLIAIDGDPTAFVEGATATPGIESVDCSDGAGDRSYALVVMRATETPLFDAIHEASTERGLVVRTPMVYRDGEMVGTVVGQAETIQDAMADAPDAIDVRVDEIGRFRGGRDDPTATLSERQRAAVQAALDIGYYEQPRGGTHADVAEKLDCAPATASDHLQKAEAKLVRAATDDLGPRE